MVLQNVLGSLSSWDATGQQIDFVALEWYETGKKILHKKTNAGQEVTLKRLNETRALQQGDVIFASEQLVIAITVNPCDAISVVPQNMFEMAAICYEIGNKHLPLFYEEGALLMPFEQPIFKTLQASGYLVKKVNAQLLHPLRTSVLPHTDSVQNSGSLFSKILKFTSAEKNG